MLSLDYEYSENNGSSVKLIDFIEQQSSPNNLSNENEQHLNDMIEVIMSQKTKKSLEEKQRVKASMKPSYKKKVGNFIVSFN